MSWPTRFREILKRTELPALVLSVRSVEVGLTTSSYSVASHLNVGNVSGLEGSSLRVSSGSLAMRSWSSKAGGFSFSVAADAFDSAARLYWTAGTVLEVIARFEGDTSEARIALGWLDNIVEEGGRVTVECLDLQTLLQSRLATKASEAQLFHGLPGETVTTVSAVVSTTVTLADASQFERWNGAHGAFRVSGVDYRYTGKSGNDLTGVTLLDGTAGTPAVSSSVQPLALLEGHPVDIAIAVLVSTGTLNDNGVYDELPASWGYALPEHLIGAKYSKSVAGNVSSDALSPLLGGTTKSGVHDGKWHLVVDAPVENGWTWIKSWLAPAGLFLDLRQGQLIVAAVQTPHTATDVTDFEITDTIIAHGRVEFYDGKSVGEYGSVYIDYVGDGSANQLVYGTTSSEEVATLPVLGEELVFDFSSFCPDALLSAADKTDVESDVNTRIARFYTRRGERLHLRLAGLAAAHLHRGLVIPVTTSRHNGRLPGSFEQQPMMITDLAAGWDENDVRVQLVALPPDEGRFYKKTWSPSVTHSATYTKVS